MTTKATTRAVEAEAYLDLPYHISLVQDEWEDGTPGWYAQVEELPGCMSQGQTPDEAVKRVKDAMLGWISVALEDGHEVPLPRGSEDEVYSGRLLLRIPRSLHAELVRRAKHERTSLNQMLVSLLAGGVSWRASNRWPTIAKVSVLEDRLVEVKSRTGRVAARNSQRARLAKGGEEMSEGDVHTVPREEGGWANKREGAARASSTHGTKQEAVQAGREQAKRSGSEHVIHKKDGTIGDRNSYGGDSPRRKG